MLCSLVTTAQAGSCCHRTIEYRYVRVRYGCCTSKYPVELTHFVLLYRSCCLVSAAVLLSHHQQGLESRTYWASRNFGSASKLELCRATNSGVRDAEAGGTSDESSLSAILCLFTLCVVAVCVSGTCPEGARSSVCVPIYLGGAANEDRGWDFTFAFANHHHVLCNVQQ